MERLSSSVKSTQKKTGQLRSIQCAHWETMRPDSLWYQLLDGRIRALSTTSRDKLYDFFYVWQSCDLLLSSEGGGC